jgi:ferritin-like protein
MSSESYHESLDKLSESTRDMHRAITSLMEELEAVDWYQQRVDATEDADLKAILSHNRDEEKEHAAMVLEWIRRKDPKFDAELRDWLFTDKPFASAVAASHDHGDESAAHHTPVREMSVGSLRGGK